MLVDEPAGQRKPTTTPTDENKDWRRTPASMPVSSSPRCRADRPKPKDDDNFARVTFDQIGGIKDVRIQDAEPLRIDGQSGYQTLAKAKDAQGDADLMVVQWLRFGTGGLHANDRRRARRSLARHADAAAHGTRQHRDRGELDFAF